MEPSAIPPGEIHLWRASLEVSDAQLSDLRLLLDQRERKRAKRFRIPRAERRFVAARTVLRTLLGRVMGTPPETVEFSYGERGKPAVAGAPHFNASDSGETVVVALASEDLGIDIEDVRPLPHPDRLARRICTENELEHLAAVPEPDREVSLLRLWTVKEAALKAIGLGLPGGMRNVEADLQPGVAPQLRRLCGRDGEWSLLTPDIGPGLLCSIVVRGTGWRLVRRDFSFHPADAGTSEHRRYA